MEGRVSEMEWERARERERGEGEKEGELNYGPWMEDRWTQGSSIGMCRLCGVFNGH